MHGTSSYLKFRLQVGIFTGDILDARTVLVRVQVVVAHDDGLRIGPMQFFEQSSECFLLRLSARVGGLTADVAPALVADADAVGVVVLAVGSYHPVRTAWLDLSVTTDDVVVSDAEVEASLSVPGVDLGGRGCLVWPHCRTMNDNQRDGSHKAFMQEVVDSAVRNAVSAATKTFTPSSRNFLFNFITLNY